MTEADYLRRELVEARTLLASASGLLEASQKIAPDFGKLDCVERILRDIAELQTHGIHILPEGVTRDA